MDSSFTSSRYRPPSSHGVRPSPSPSPSPAPSSNPLPRHSTLPTTPYQKLSSNTLSTQKNLHPNSTSRVPPAASPSPSQFQNSASSTSFQSPHVTNNNHNLLNHNNNMNGSFSNSARNPSLDRSFSPLSSHHHEDHGPSSSTSSSSSPSPLSFASSLSNRFLKVFKGHKYDHHDDGRSNRDINGADDRRGNDESDEGNGNDQNMSNNNNGNDDGTEPIPFNSDDPHPLFAPILPSFSSSSSPSFSLSSSTSSSSLPPPSFIFSHHLPAFPPPFSISLSEQHGEIISIRRQHPILDVTHYSDIVEDNNLVMMKYLKSDGQVVEPIQLPRYVERVRGRRAEDSLYNNDNNENEWNEEMDKENNKGTGWVRYMRSLLPWGGNYPSKSTNIAPSLRHRNNLNVHRSSSTPSTPFTPIFKSSSARGIEINPATPLPLSSTSSSSSLSSSFHLLVVKSISWHPLLSRFTLLISYPNASSSSSSSSSVPDELHEYTLDSSISPSSHIPVNGAFSPLILSHSNMVQCTDVKYNSQNGNMIVVAMRGGLGIWRIVHEREREEGGKRSAWMTLIPIVKEQLYPSPSSSIPHVEQFDISPCGKFIIATLSSSSLLYLIDIPLSLSSPSTLISIITISPSNLLSLFYSFPMKCVKWNPKRTQMIAAVNTKGAVRVIDVFHSEKKKKNEMGGGGEGGGGLYKSSASSSSSSSSFLSLFSSSSSFSSETKFPHLIGRSVSSLSWHTNGELLFLTFDDSADIVAMNVSSSSSLSSLYTFDMAFSIPSYSLSSTLTLSLPHTSIHTFRISPSSHRIAISYHDCPYIYLFHLSNDIQIQLSLFCIGVIKGPERKGAETMIAKEEEGEEEKERKGGRKNKRKEDEDREEKGGQGEEERRKKKKSEADDQDDDGNNHNESEDQQDERKNDSGREEKSSSLSSLSSSFPSLSLPPPPLSSSSVHHPSLNCPLLFEFRPSFPYGEFLVVHWEDNQITFFPMYFDNNANDGEMAGRKKRNGLGKTMNMNMRRM